MPSLPARAPRRALNNPPPSARSIAARALIFALFSLCFASSTPAQDDPTREGSNPTATPTSGAPQKTTADLLVDLNSPAPSNRLYAARSLHTQLRTSLRRADHAPEGSIARDEALSRLIELEARIPEACLAALQFENVVPSCGEMLAMLDTRSAVPTLAEALTTVKGKSARRRVEASLACLRDEGPCPQETGREWTAAHPAR